MSKKYLIVGATGYLGKQLVHAAKRAGHKVRALARDASRLPAEVDEVVVAEATNPDSLAGICNGVDVVISALGITRQRDGLTYNAVDYAANRNILNEALKGKVERFGYVHVLNSDKLVHVPMVKAKVRFAEELRLAPTASTIINPSGFYSDLGEVLRKAQSGRVYLFGNGNTRVSPISGHDMAEACISATDNQVASIDVGGPETLTFNQVAQLAFKALDKPEKITHLPLGLGKFTVRLAKLLGFAKTVGPFEFFVAASGMDMQAPNFGSQTLDDYFATELRTANRADNRNALLASS